MKVEDLQTLYDYGYWANEKLFAVTAGLTPEEFTRPLGGGYGSIRSTMVHVLSAEWGWLGRCGGPERVARLDPEGYPTLESVLETWRRVEAYVREFVPRLKDEDLARNVEFTIDGTTRHSMPLGELLHHAAVHGVHHRGQIALLLRLLGHPPGNFDLLFYYAEKRGLPAP
jgi:uncharacterized damage-inducible protein DinB